MEEKYNYLQMIQDIITRMASNSFKLKGWAVTLVVGIFSLANKDSDKMYFLVSFIPVLVFWGLDSFYLLQERLYRALYEKVRLMQPEDPQLDFSLSVTTQEFNDQKCNYWNCVFSRTELLFYFPLAILCAAIIIVTHI